MASRVALVMPAYNEQAGIREFLDELRNELQPHCATLDIVVVDDQSTDQMPRVLDEYAHEHPEVQVIHAECNRGHGPTALAAYRAGLACNPDYLIFVDGDGQFLGSDVVRALRGAESSGADVVHGVRTGRTDPWYRRALTEVLAIVVAAAAGGRVPDVNTPLRVYRPNTLRWLLQAFPEDATVPHVHFSLAEARLHVPLAFLAVKSIPRRGEAEQGSTWGGDRVPRLPPPRLRGFVKIAARELWQCSLRPGSTAHVRRIRNEALAHPEKSR